MGRKVLVSILLCIFFVAQLHALTIEGNSPNESNISGRKVIAIRGCGFREYNTAVCTWDFKYFSPIHVILSDDLIYCETPQLTKDDFDVLPAFTTLFVYFDGDRENNEKVSSNFKFGPSIVSFTPFDGYVNGGEEFRIIGDGFNEFSSVNVTFDNVSCLNTTILSNNEILCTVPPGEFNQNAIVNLKFENNSKYYLHFEKTYHYGPILNGISPSCGLVTGGTRVTVLGVNLDDPSLTLDAAPANVLPDVEVIYNNGQKRMYALDVNFVPGNNLITFTTPNISNVFGEKVQFAVYFKKILNKVAVTVPGDFTYGPIIYNSLNPGNFNYAGGSYPITNPSITSGTLGGGEYIFLYGCGLSQFNVSQYNIFYNTQPFCRNGTIELFTSGYLEAESLSCIVAPLACGTTINGNRGNITVQLNANITGIADPQILPPSTEATLTYQAGPTLDITSISSNRGPRTGGQLVSIYGSNLYYSANSSPSSPGWNVTVNFVPYENVTAIVIPSVRATFVAENLISFVTPPGLFDLDVAITFTFGNCTGALQNTFSLYHYGPLCHTVTPQNGHYTGGSTVTLIGEGFEEDNNLESDTYVQMCISRLSNITYCAYEQVPRDSFSLVDDQIIFQTPSARQNVATKVGYNILFGDLASVYIHFYQPGGEFIEFPRNQLRPGLNEAVITCGTYTFAPKINSITPNNGQVVPRFNGTPLPVEIQGDYFDDPNLQNRLVVGVSNVVTLNPSISSDQSISAEVNWGLQAGTDNSVFVFFDSGNQTFSSVNVGFGPAIYSISTPYSPLIAGDDVYGLFPAGGQHITIIGERFTDDSGDLKVTIGGDEVECQIESSTEIVCVTPCKPYGTRAQLTMSFGTTCFPGLYDYSNSLTASQYLYYNPRINSFSPNFGRTSGGESVTILGEGFAGWGKYECFFGHYSDQQHVTPSADGTTIVCNTPINRAEFNTYVSVQIQLSAYDDDDAVESGYVEGDQQCSDRQTFVDEGFYAGVENHDFKVFASDKYYYGPTCTNISPSSCPTTGCVAAVVGNGFRDCSTGNQTVYTKNYPYNDCIFRYYKVRYVDPTTKEITYLNGPTNDTLSPGNSDTKLFYYAPASECGYEPEIEIEFFSPDVSTAPSSDGLVSQAVIQCSSGGRAFDFHYGPVVAAQTSKYFDGVTSYGWSGDSVTITGVDFRDPNVFGAITCNFGDLSVPASSVDTTGSTVVCQVPTVSGDYWNTLVDITLTYSGGALTCPAVPAQKFHFGPTIRSSTPQRGYVAGQTPITISGFAFGCCGITSYSCLFPRSSSSAQLSGTNAVTCNVPQNDEIDVQLNNIGISFTSSLFGTNRVTFTEYGTSLKYYYGPYVNSYVNPSHSTLSGRDQTVTISGEGFDDPYLLETFCDFFTQTSPGFDFVPRDPLEEVFITATTITCPIPTFYHYAGAIDQIRPRWRRAGTELRPELGKNYYKTLAPIVPDQPGEPYFSDGGSDTPFYISGFKYGPVITNVCVGSSCGSSLPRSPLTGGLKITVSFDSLRDFVATPGTLDFGRENAVCVFGNRFSTTLVPITANPDDDDGGSVVCTTPPGDFGFTGELSVILNPNIIARSTTASRIFHARPYTNGISRDWASTSGYETIVVYGSGFCKYNSVQCYFSNGESLSDATQGDITSDFMVTCRTPPRPAGPSFITLKFCANLACGVCENDIVQVPEQITFYGINSVTPIDGSLCGGSTIQFSGYGFSNFDRITCSFPNSGLQVGNIVDDNLFTCSSVDISLLFNDDFVHCSQVSVIGIRDNFNYPLNVPSRFEYGLPQLLSITPPTQEMSSLGQIVARGLYFNGNGFNVDCQFGGFISSPGTLIAESNGEYAVLCFPPSSITVGTYDFSLVFSCSTTAQFTTNVLHFTVTQTPIIEQVRPIAGPEIGGQTITISGFNFNGGSLYLCVFGKIAVGATYDESASVITCKTPAFLDTYEDVKIPLYVSLDGGETLFRSRDDYIYQNIAVVQDGNVCVNDNDINDGSHLSPASIFVTILFVCISLAFF